MRVLALVLVGVACVSGFSRTGVVVARVVVRPGTGAPHMFDFLKGDPEAKRRKEAEKEEMMAAQKEILERRRNPKKMREYEEAVDAKRLKLAEERAMYNFQREEGADPIEKWKALRDDGSIKMSKDLERDAKTSRLGSEGLIEVRVDERMPYIDQGYVDEGPDILGKISNFFKKKDEKK